MQTRTSQCVSVIANRLSCFLQDGSRPWHRLYGTQPACKSWTATDLQVHVLRICKYDYNPGFGNLQDGREKWAESPNFAPIMRFSVVQKSQICIYGIDKYTANTQNSLCWMGNYAIRIIFSWPHFCTKRRKRKREKKKKKRRKEKRSKRESKSKRIK